MAYVIEQRHNQWILRNVSETITMMRDGERVPMGEVICQGTKLDCHRAQRKHTATYTLIHAMGYIRKRLEFSPANGVALRILECSLDAVSR